MPKNSPLVPGEKLCKNEEILLAKNKDGGPLESKVEYDFSGLEKDELLLLLDLIHDPVKFKPLFQMFLNKGD